MDIIIEKFDSILDIKKQRKLFDECFPENIGTPAQTEAHYNWKFKSFPAEIKSYEYCAKIDDEIIGYYAAIPYEYIINGKQYTSAMVCDVMTGVKARGKGVFTKLGAYATDQYFKEGLSFSTGYPIRNEVIPGHKKVGWEFPFEIPMYGKFLLFNSFLKNKNKGIYVPVFNIMLAIYNFLNRVLSKHILRTSDLLSIETYDSDQLSMIEGLDEFYGKWKSQTPIALNKNKEFIKWRLGGPGKQYKIYVLRANLVVVGYAVTRNIDKEGVPCLGILDYILLNGYEKYSSVLLSKIEHNAKIDKIELLLVMMMRSYVKKYRLSINGYLKTPYVFSFIIKKYNKILKDEDLFEEKNWNLMWIDSDDL